MTVAPPPTSSHFNNPMHKADHLQQHHQLHTCTSSIRFQNTLHLQSKSTKYQQEPPPCLASTPRASPNQPSIKPIPPRATPPPKTPSRNPKQGPTHKTTVHKLISAFPRNKRRARVPPHRLEEVSMARLQAKKPKAEQKRDRLRGESDRYVR